MAKKRSMLQNPGIVLLTTYLLLFVTNSIVIFIANAVVPTRVVLGTIHLSLFWALVLSMSAVSLVGTFAIPLINEWEQRRKNQLTPRDWMILYFAINCTALWLVSRAAGQFGLGISSWVIVAILALILDVIQGIVMMKFEKARPKD